MVNLQGEILFGIQLTLFQKPSTDSSSNGRVVRPSPLQAWLLTGLILICCFLILFLNKTPRIWKQQPRPLSLKMKETSHLLKSKLSGHDYQKMSVSQHDQLKKAIFSSCCCFQDNFVDKAHCIPQNDNGHDNNKSYQLQRVTPLSSHWQVTSSPNLYNNPKLSILFYMRRNQGLESGAAWAGEDTLFSQALYLMTSTHSFP